MKVYAVRKRAGLWAVCSDENVVLNFDSYEQAIDTARSALGVLSKVHDDAQRKLSGLQRCAQKPGPDETGPEESGALDTGLPEAC
jgi:hypothetical protein